MVIHTSYSSPPLSLSLSPNLSSRLPSEISRLTGKKNKNLPHHPHTPTPITNQLNTHSIQIQTTNTSTHTHTSMTSKQTNTHIAGSVIRLIKVPITEGRRSESAATSKDFRLGVFSAFPDFSKDPSEELVKNTQNNIHNIIIEKMQRKVPLV